MGDVKDDGGAAFPRTVQAWNGNLTAHEGMTLRDWFAGQALTAIGGVQFPADAGRAAPLVARLAYEVADAMLAARKGGDA